ncbi:bifunctional ([pyruvate, phosphate dikinase] phosphate) phosphotransferase/[pyruvate, phosphate dikinase] kinase [Halobacteriovorax sp. DA5]|nr:bifunctional ([pyruvate, phosphate dikinase] phosphate) phosphotransferase/[pyruvate, phosphate dikinase] kinase [Halobacteriovorax sp. DA5]
MKKMKIIIISDGTGSTAKAISRAAMTQFPESEVFYTGFKNVRTKEQIKSIFDEAAIHHDLVIYTIVSAELREYTKEISMQKHVRSLDLMGPVLTTFSNYFHQEPKSEPGLLHAVNSEYFDRVAAMEFTLNHDDGRNVETLHLADVILVGISRTSKTPLSVYLSQHGIKVVNIPIINGQDLPKELFEIDQRKIFALTIDPEALYSIRKNRLNKLGATEHTGDYADTNKVIEELEWANEIFGKNKRWPVFDVTDRALEETATDIMKLLQMRKNNIFKQLMSESDD